MEVQIFGIQKSKDTRKALEYYRKAVARNHPDAHNNLGYLYQHGIEVEKDLDRARAHFEKAAELGLRTEEGWIDVRKVDGRGHESFGYDAMTALWRRETRPEGLLTYPDTVARGVTMAILEQGIRVRLGTARILTPPRHPSRTANECTHTLA